MVRTLTLGPQILDVRLSVRCAVCGVKVGKVQSLPGKMIDHFYGYDHILEPMYHFTGVSFYRGT